MTTKEFIGNDLYLKYRNIYPLVRLLLSRMDFTQKSDEKIFGYFFSYDGGGLSEQRTIRGKAAFLSGLIPYIINSFKNTKRKKEEKILISDTLLNSERYSYFQRECLKNKQVIGISVVLNHRISKHVKKYTRSMNMGVSITGGRLKKEILKTYRLLVNIYEKKSTCQEHYEIINEQFAVLDRLFQRRLNVIKRQLLKNNVRLYITCNQYRIEEILLITACHELGIRTKEWSHHAYSTLHINLRKNEGAFSDGDNRFVYADEMCVWDKADIVWLKKYDTIEGLLESDVKISVVGSPEIEKSTVQKEICKYKRKNQIAFFVPSISPKNLAENSQLEKRKQEIFYQLFNLSKKNNMKVIVRYHPGVDLKKLESDMNLCKKYGFEVDDNSRDSFVKIISSSKAVLGYHSASLVVAYNYGAKSYSINLYHKEKFDFCGVPIHEVEINEIGNISNFISDGSIAEDAMNLALLFQ